MPRAKNKSEFLESHNKNFDKLITFIESLPEPQAPFTSAIKDNSRNKNIRDIMAHIYEWQELMRRFIIANHNLDSINENLGRNVAFLLEPYNWRTYPQMNEYFWQKYQQSDLDSILSRTKAAHKDISQLIEQFSQEALFTKGYFSHTGGVHLASYFISSGSSHYVWALKCIKRGLR